MINKGALEEDKSLYENAINEATLDFGELAEEVMGDKYDDTIS